jgi:D-alanine-D-alanine ligase
VNEQRKIRVAVIFGGRGPEHAVSCMGGGNVLRAIDRDRYEVVPVGITREGGWVLASDEPSRLMITEGQLPSVEAVAEPGSQVVPWAGTPGQALTTSAPARIPHLLSDVDVVLPLLHGPFGEDGTIQGLLEMAGVPYVGAGVLASAVSMDKEYMKIIFQARGLPVGPYVVVREHDWPPEGEGDTAADLERKRVFDAITELGWPLFVKPARGGSSIGTSKASDLTQLHASIENARAFDPKVIVEAAVEGSEIECAVLEGQSGNPPDASIPAQLMIDGGEEFYDFEAKYLDQASAVAIPPPIPVEDQQEIRRMAALAFDAVSCEGLARVDFFYTPDGQIVINEINTIPGFALTSAFPMMWAATGLDLTQLIDRMLQTALRKGTGLR